mmetsp:Transcript_1771/g.5488  ORF Transcript_1771/g.5488 Transcript_1771/m.5488 type:complete len:711 (-) Transcript_1771:2253-4385(-)
MPKSHRNEVSSHPTAEHLRSSLRLATRFLFPMCLPHCAMARSLCRPPPWQSHKLPLSVRSILTSRMRWPLSRAQTFCHLRHCIIFSISSSSSSSSSSSHSSLACPASPSSSPSPPLQCLSTASTLLPQDHSDEAHDVAPSSPTPSLSLSNSRRSNRHPHPSSPLSSPPQSPSSASTASSASSSLATTVRFSPLPSSAVDSSCGGALHDSPWCASTNNSSCSGTSSPAPQSQPHQQVPWQGARSTRPLRSLTHEYVRRPPGKFTKGFLRSLESGEFSDLTLVTADGRRHAVHRLVLARSSAFFAGLLGSDFAEKDRRCIQLNFPDPEHVFDSVLRFMYGAEVKLTPENAVPLLAAADQFLIEPLRNQAHAYIESNLAWENVLLVLRKASQFEGCADDVVRCCVDVIARNFAQLFGQDLSFLPLRVFRDVLSHRFLAVKNEHELYQAICSYISCHQDSLDHEQKCELMENVRFVWMEYDQLLEAAQNSLVPRELLIEALLYRLKLHEKPDSPDTAHERRQRFSRRMAHGMRFEFKYHGDKNGVIYWIATRKGARAWENPHRLGEIVVRASSIEKGDPVELVGWLPTELWTKDVPASWFSIDLGHNRSVVPTHYSLRHGSKYKSDCLRTWDFQGSKDGKKWTLLQKHQGDQGLNGAFAVHTWPVDSEGSSFRYFRVLQTAHNSSNHNFLSLSGIELYGDLYENVSLSVPSTTR